MGDGPADHRPSLVRGVVAMTRFEQIAAAFPLHAQRIAECVCETDGEWRLERFLTFPHPETRAGDILQGAFLWEKTAEGWSYWNAIAHGGGVL